MTEISIHLDLGSDPKKTLGENDYTLSFFKSVAGDAPMGWLSRPLGGSDLSNLGKDNLAERATYEIAYTLAPVQNGCADGMSPSFVVHPDALGQLFVAAPQAPTKPHQEDPTPSAKQTGEGNA